MEVSKELQFQEVELNHWHSFQTSLRITNVANSLRRTVILDERIGRVHLGDGLGWKAHLYIGDDLVPNQNVLGIFISAPSKSWDRPLIIRLDLKHVDGTLFGQLKIERVFTDSAAYGESNVVSLETLRKNLKDDAFILVINVQEIPAVEPTFDVSRPELSLSASQAINRSFIYPSDDMDIKFLNYNSNPCNNNLRIHVRESYSCGQILANTTKYFASHAAFSEGIYVTTSDPDTLDSIPDFNASYDYVSDSDLEPDDELEDEPMLLDEHSTPHITKPTRNREEMPLPDTKKWKVIVIGDIAHRTWLAILGYLYTDAILFAPLSSKKVVKTAIEGQAKLAFPHVSCKSVFRVADKLGLPALENSAFLCLKSQIDDETIFPEIFSSFTARYERVKDMEFDYLTANWARLQSSDILNQMLDEVGNGKRPQSVWLLHRIVQKSKLNV